MFFDSVDPLKGVAVVLVSDMPVSELALYRAVYSSLAPGASAQVGSVFKATEAQVASDSKQWQ